MLVNWEPWKETRNEILRLKIQIKVYLTTNIGSKSRYWKLYTGKLRVTTCKCAVNVQFVLLVMPRKFGRPARNLRWELS